MTVERRTCMLSMGFKRRRMKDRMGNRFGCLCVLIVTAFITTNAAAQVSLDNTYGGTRGYGTDCLSPNDDGSSAIIDLLPAFPRGLRFFDRTHTSTYVNTNGNITFSGALGTYTPRAFPVANQPMIAPYWGDVDIRGASCSGYGGDLGCSNPSTNGVWWHMEPGLFVVTWDQVGYFLCHDDLKMSFQLILTAVEGCGGEGDFDVEFRFNRCEWTTGDASGGSGGFGGTPAQAGFDAGNSTDFVEIPGSRTDSIHTIMCTDSNVGLPGIWRFQIRSGQILCPEAGDPCDTELLGICAQGTTQCIGDDLSEIVCIPLVQPTDERCDAIDNDCDGEIDEGDDLCDTFQVCDRGHCVDPCSEFGCPDGQICGEAGLCVDPLCVDVVCGPGERCEGGDCFGACDGVVCPHGQSCLGGRCVDLCESLTCDECTVCVDGICELRCQYADCAEGQSCLDSGLCVETSCVDVVCDPGAHCEGGACVDSCVGAVCPRGEVCEVGQCVPEPDGDGGVVEASCRCKPTVAGATPRGDGLVVLLSFGLLGLFLRRRPRGSR
jgi:hypothetical protein